MSERIVDSLPRGWAWATIEDLIAAGGLFTDGDWIESKDQDPNGDVRLIQLADIGEGLFLDRSSRFLTSEKARELRCTFLHLGDLLIARMPDPLGRACIFPGTSQQAVTAVDVCIVRPNTELVSNKWLMWIINSPQVRREVASMQSGSTRKRISRRNLATIKLPIPPVAEQERILREIEMQLSRLDASVSHLLRARANLKRYREKILTAACEGRLVSTEAELARMEGRGYESSRQFLRRTLDKPATVQHRRVRGLSESADFEKIGAISLPQGWTWTSLAELKQFSLYGPRFSSEDYRQSGRVVVRTTDISDSGRVDTRFAPRLPLDGDEFSRYQLVKGDMLFTRTGHTVGKVAVFNDEAEAIPGAYLIQYRLQVPIETAWYIYHYFRSPGAQRKLVVGAAGVGRPNLNAPTIEAIEIPLPPFAEQKRIVQEIERRLSVLRAIEKNVEQATTRSEHLRGSILKAAFEGKLVAGDPAEEPASALLERIHREREGENGRGERTRNAKPRRGPGIKPGVSTPGTGTTPTPPKPRRGAGSVGEESAYAPSGLPDSLVVPSLGLKPQALRPGPAGAEEKGKTLDVPAPSAGRRGEEETAFLDLPRETQVDLVWESLLGRGALEKEEAIRTAAQALRDQGRAQFQRFRQGGPLYQAIVAALDRGIRDGSFDRPRRGHVRALLNDPKDYSPDEWRLCLLSSLDHEAVDEDDALRSAANWAQENLGLEFARLREDGVILRGLREALNELAWQGKVKRFGGTVRRARS